ncbi:bifunctional diaminohydroxyphosphoribosylaminopyrimidine deaminase/5-amino-6-(5-phosphoribosylamino)uracil reductase RibD [Aliidiomarina celeris]|uniref:bifunctional diaminohydroxyphosphoribosylaminopyrimidine deaminase/5-amino-6-(5-phosphoribosylamino)uracil reductase RibD n=1 Tax=Aliidiomarina celeris TaxID=2249428 RepID=UPI0018E5FBDD|nr:bifunctional diaminohydroxyphosphoribosylaminopyrimidine deaminase/5-amino-6-(5-phosphoribosylamino)uracil reductase RibD [Aliidiomarina celeris]
MTKLMAHDNQYMQRALELAARGRFTTHPNPNVGCVIVNKSGDIVGEGWHERAGEPHAEVFALRQAGEQARGGTAYVTLEPCSHFGRTPPCADALVEAGLARVVVAMRDPFEAVAGRGIAKLLAAGVDVSVGVEEQAARQINRGFLQRCEQGLPLVQVKLAASLDGRTALQNGESKWITGAEARADVQYGRAAAGAILTGADTVLADDPQMNVRLAEASRQPIRVIIDSQGRVQPNARIFADQVPCILVRTRTLNVSMPNHVEELIVADDHGKVDLKTLLKRLAERNIHTVWVEAGHRLAGAVIEQKLADELWVYIAGKLMGPSAQPMLALPNYEHMGELPTLNLQSVTPIGNDVKLIYDLSSREGVARSE